MSLLQRFREKTRDWLRSRTLDIVQGGELYLRRVVLAEFFGYRLCLHWIYKPDADRDPHDHPWDFITVPLRRSYLEERWERRMRDAPDWSCVVYPPQYGRVLCGYQRVGWLRPRWRRAEHLHRVFDLPDGPALTLVLMMPPRRRWGFVCQDGAWVYWREYLNVTPEQRAAED